MIYIFLLITFGVIAGFLYFWLRQQREVAYGVRSKRMQRLSVVLPKKESADDQQKEMTHDIKESLAAAEQLISSLHGIRTPWFKSLRDGHDYFGFEIVLPNTSLTEEEGDKPEVQFFLLTLPEHRSLLEKQVMAYYPDAEIGIVKTLPLMAPNLQGKTATFSQRTNKLLPFKTYKNLAEDGMNGMVNSLSLLKPDEGIGIQFLFHSLDNGWVSEGNKTIKNLQAGKGESGDGFLSLLLPKNPNATPPQASPLDQVKAEAIGEKIKKVGFNTKVRILSTAPTDESAETNLRSVVAAFSNFEETQLNALVVCFGNEKDIIEKFQTMNFWGGDAELTLNTEELVSMVHFPDKRFNRSESIQWLSFRKVSAPSNTPKSTVDGIKLGENESHGIKTEVYVKRDDRTRHFYCIGKSGSGKSTLLEYMIKQDINRGEGVCVIDPHGDLAEAVLPYIPKERVKDVIYFNPGDTERPMGLNLLEAPADKHDFITGQALQIFIKLFGEEVFGPRLQHYFRNGCLTLMDDEESGGTLIEIPRLFIDPEFQKEKVAKVKNPVVRAFWEKEMANTGDKEKQEMIPYLTSKFGQFITDGVVRNIIGQPVSCLDMRKAMDEQKIVLVNLSKGVIGEQNMSLLGMILVTKVQMAAMSRFNQKAEDRKDFYLYVDEFQNFATDAFGSILSEARKYRLNLIVAHQYISQLKEEIKDAVFGNVGSMLCFKIGAADADYMAKEFAPVYNEQDIVNIPNYKAYIKLCIDNATSTAFSMNTIYDKSGKNEVIGEKIKQISRLLLGRDKATIDEQTRARAGG